MQKGTYAKRGIKKGTSLSIDEVNFLRPMGEISPKEFYLNFKNKIVNRDLKIGEEIKKEYFKI